MEKVSNFCPSALEVNPGFTPIFVFYQLSLKKLILFFCMCCSFCVAINNGNSNAASVSVYVKCVTPYFEAFFLLVLK